MLYIFDWDGTLSQSLEHIVAAIDYAASATGLPALSPERQRSVIGLGLEQAFVDLYPDADAGQQRSLLNHYRERYLHLNAQRPSPLFAGVEETLEHLLDQGHELAVATGKRRAGLDRVLQDSGIGHLFRATRCVDEAASKPHPLMLRQLLEMTGYDAPEALVVGDTDFDLLMARDADIRAIGVTYGAHPKERLLACEPVRLIDDIRQLNAILI